MSHFFFGKSWESIFYPSEEKGINKIYISYEWNANISYIDILVNKSKIIVLLKLSAQAFFVLKMMIHHQ